ncbi:sugar ABC transporter permease [Alicyclobacillus sendaiensis]|uniref:sugar ABC transporter permease n=1 Tax=Alicyclobacillus sendaiensis TaxID=192387 RepID=UPI001FDFB380|nr:sugar ABC transporter permease [Alicyclobacillus sendaiensis]
MIEDMARVNGVRHSDNLRAWIIRLVLWIVIILTLAPLLYVVTASFSSSDALSSASLLPVRPTLDNYKAVISAGFLRWAWNSTLVAFVVSFIQVVITSTAAYAFSRMHFIGRRYGLMILLVLQMFPNSMSVAAIYAVLAKWGLLDRLWIYILLLVGGSAFNIWLMKGFFDTIPKELDEAALVDGASNVRIFLNIVLPLARPMLAVIFFLSVIGYYSEYILAGTVLQSPGNYTLGLGMYNLINTQFAQNWGLFSAASLMSAIPLAVAFTILNPLMARGLTAGATKG